MVTVLGNILCGFPVQAKNKDKVVTPSRIKKICQRVEYKYTDNTGKEVSTVVNEVVGCSFPSCKKHTGEYVINGLKAGKKASKIYNCACGSNLYMIKVPVKTVKDKRIVNEYKTLKSLHFYSIQGSCIHKENLYIAFSDKAKKSKDIKNKTDVGLVNLTAVVKLKFDDKKFKVAQVEVFKGIEKIDDAINYMGHANDMTFDKGRLYTSWYKLEEKKSKKKGKKKTYEIKRFTLGYIDITGEGNGQAMNIGLENKKAQKSVFGITKRGKKTFAVGIRQNKDRYVDLYKYKESKNGKTKYRYYKKKRLFSIKTKYGDKKDKFNVCQCMCSNGEYIFVCKFTKKNKGNNNSIQIYENNKYKSRIIVKDPVIKKPNDKKKNLSYKKWELEGFGSIGGNKYYCIMAMPNPDKDKTKPKRLLKNKQAYLYKIKIKP